MTLRNWCTISSIIGFAFGLGFVLASGPLLAIYGVKLDPAGTLIAQLFGALLLSFGLLNWLARGITDAKALSAIVLSNLVGDVVGFIFALLAQLAGVANQMGWSTVAIYLLLALGWAYFQFMKSGK